MKTHFIRYLLILLSLSFYIKAFSADNDQLIETAIYTFGSFEYTVMTDREQNNALTDSQMYSFHKYVLKHQNVLLTQFNLSQPAKTRITICNNSKIFESETGQKAQTATFYDRAKRVLFLQEIRGLKEQNILKQTIQHKMLYLLLDTNRALSVTPGLRVLEEAFCEYHFTKGRKPEVSTLPESYTTFARHLYRAIEGDDAVKQEKAFALLNLWGAHLIKKIGAKAYLDILLKEREDKNELPQKHYDSFRKEYNETIANNGGI
ncbi:MAG TPA: hypothetical protein P5123_12550 [Spirochaetota bacterium]|nr:hypothetical protein [Spirochaetota bacterium]